MYCCILGKKYEIRIMARRDVFQSEELVIKITIPVDEETYCEDESTSARYEIGQVRLFGHIKNINLLIKYFLYVQHKDFGSGKEGRPRNSSTET